MRQVTSPDVSVALLFELCNLSLITLFVHDDPICFILGADVNQMKLIKVTTVVTGKFCREAVYYVGWTLNALNT